MIRRSWSRLQARRIGNGVLSQMSVVRVLVVDDSQAWQKFIGTQLVLCSNVAIIATESDGLEAVIKAGELQPDLVLLDIHLVTLNGIEVARQIREVAPKSIILFVSAESDPDIVRAAFGAGGHGYVLKQEAAMDLLVGMDAVLSGRRFVSRGLGDAGNLT